MTPLRRLLAAAAACLAAAAPSALAASSTGDAVASGPPVVARGGAAVRAALVLPDAVPSHRVELAAPGAAELAAHAAFAARRDGKGQPLAIGFGREVAGAARRVPLPELTWVAAPDGSRSARFTVASPGAAALRVALALPASAAGLSVRFAASGAERRVFGAYAGAAIAADTATDGQFWSPVLAGDVATIELVVPAGAPIPADTLVVPRVSHQVVAEEDLRVAHAKTGIGAAGSCNVDIACVTPPSAPLLALARAVAKLQFVRADGRSYLCSGTLVGDTVNSSTPYLLTANHCIDSAAIARTINTYWFFDATACGSTLSPPYVRLTGGAALLGASPDRDWSIVRLLEAPPAGAVFAAWRAEALAPGTAVTSVHHPEGDLKKVSTGATTGSLFIDDSGVYGDFTEVVWSKGVTEAGSSGGALATLAPGGAYYEVRGGLYAGISACSLPHEPDYFSGLESALPVMRQYLTPDAANPAGLVAATEFYNGTLDHYFLSTDPVEIAKLDSGATVGWVRTGARFVVYAAPAAGTNPVCRFYRAPAYGDSHFYSASPAECAATAAAHPVDWIYESPGVFHARLPDAGTGACPAGTKPVYRFFNRYTVNHRYTTEIVTRNALAASPSWTAEGYGPGPYYPVMCAPAG